MLIFIESSLRHSLIHLSTIHSYSLKSRRLPLSFDVEIHESWVIRALKLIADAPILVVMLYLTMAGHYTTASASHYP
jgi:hypothetical protein